MRALGARPAAFKDTAIAVFSKHRLYYSSYIQRGVGACIGSAQPRLLQLTRLLWRVPSVSPWSTMAWAANIGVRRGKDNTKKVDNPGGKYGYATRTLSGTRSPVTKGTLSDFDFLMDFVGS